MNKIERMIAAIGGAVPNRMFPGETVKDQIESMEMIGDIEAEACLEAAARAAFAVVDAIAAEEFAEEAKLSRAETCFKKEG